MRFDGCLEQSGGYLAVNSSVMLKYLFLKSVISSYSHRIKQKGEVVKALNLTSEFTSGE